MLIVIALGGNALLKRGEPLTMENQRINTKVAAKAIAEVISAGHQVVVTHGNGPQVGLLALQGAAYKPDEAYPLDVLGAETEGMIGYLIEQELENALPSDRQVAMLLTQIEVNPDDPAFEDPSKPVGPIYTKEEAEKIAAKRGWTIAADGDSYRRVVPSPNPVSIPDIPIIELLLKNNVVVICAGGGGIPIVRDKEGKSTGIEAVIDKDKASALLAKKIGADMLLMLTDVDAVYENFGTADQSPIKQASAAEIRLMSLAKGSMQPKVLAACDFASSSISAKAGIGSLKDALKIIGGISGTLIF
ncbi:carbamate kinase [Cocleimonas sp. KMM 6892]|uniref:carbamate kinase n=1 Tax=unclassified Cocleimonas TaxID=2639732 RepID=UPI002DBC97AE|nr:MULTISPECIES: carbamate kinase [unclassified Cocleimonas]MEB8434361.1 carbamate kinase [Cocleimonas sp. KMM 6892]MEC4717236.1 carbamate kinase [Cocleimonas sp. KMM 6895]MEC4746615.1 carbamate kinase [Cocleimonas sp. KMM 6896]